MTIDSTIRIALVDDQDLVRSGVAMIIDNEPDLEVVAQASSAETGVELALERRPDVVLMDVNMPGGSNGIEATRQIVEQTDSKVIMLTAFDDEDTVFPPPSKPVPAATSSR